MAVAIVRDLHEVGLGWTIVEDENKNKIEEHFWEERAGTDPIYHLLQGLQKTLGLKVKIIGSDGDSVVYRIEV